MDRFDEMRRKVVQIVSEGGEVINPGEGLNSQGILPLPVSQLSFTQTKYTRGKGTVSFIFPDQATSVDILIKENDVPQGVADYNKRYTFYPDSESKDIFFDIHADGTYADQYGLWAVARNENGQQTALNNTNRKLFNFMYSQGDVSELSFTTNENLSTWYGTRLFACQCDDFMLLYGERQSSSYAKPPVFLVDLKTKEILLTGFSADGVGKVFKVKDNEYLIYASTDTSRLYLFERDERKFTELKCDGQAIGIDVNGFMPIDSSRILLYQGYGSGNNKFLYNINSRTLKNLGLSWCNFIDTNQGIFAYTYFSSYSSSSYSNFKRIYKFNKNTDNFEETLWKWSGDMDPTTQMADKRVKIYEDKYGTIWVDLEGTADGIYYWTGSYWQVSSHTLDFYGKPIFKIGSDECFFLNGNIYKFNGDNIKTLATGGTGTPETIQTFRQGSHYIICALYNSRNYVYKYSSGILENIYTEHRDLGYGFNSTLTQIDNIIYGLSEFHNIIIEDGAVKQLDLYPAILSRFQKINGKVYAMNVYSTTGKNNNVFIKEGDTFKQIASSPIRTALIDVNNLVYLVPYQELYSSAAENYVKIYDPATDTVTTSDKRIRYSLGHGYFYSASDKKVYNFEKGIEERVSISTHTNFTDGADGSDEENRWSNVSVVLNKINNGIQILYLN